MKEVVCETIVWTKFGGPLEVKLPTIASQDALPENGSSKMKLLNCST